MSLLSIGESGKCCKSKNGAKESFSRFADECEMASGVHPQTPKKTYKSSASGKLSCCRLCRSTSEVHFKNIFAKANRVLLIAAEDVYGQSLRKEDDLPHLLCRPCERRLKTFREFKLKITETQDSFERAKRCIEVLPSVPRTLSKSAKDSSERSSRRGLDFNAAEKQVKKTYKQCLYFLVTMFYFIFFQYI